MSKFDFQSCGGEIHELQDGHVPETFRHQSSSPSSPSQWVKYPSFNQDPHVQIHDNIIPDSLLETLYQRTVQERTWGAYVSRLENHSNDATITSVVSYFLDAIGQDKVTKEILDTMPWHGVAVWGLASIEQDKVQYHLDYAELIRYEHNIMVPPILAGTLHCTMGNIKGGAFCVNLGGLKHYETHGYKGRKSGDPMAGYENPPIINKANRHMDQTTQWMTIPYQYNRIICHSGQLPHLSTPVISLPSSTVQRVIVGFNVFCHDIGPTVQQAPEHSPAFRQRLGRVMLNHHTLPPVLRQWLVLAKRHQVKKKLKEDQAALSLHITTFLPCTVQLLMDSCCYNPWPKPVDVHVHVHHLVKHGVLSCDITHEPGKLLSTEAKVSAL